MRRCLTPVVTLLLASQLSGCSRRLALPGIGSIGAPKEPTVASAVRKLPPVATVDGAAPRMTEAEVLALYRSVEGKVPDGEMSYLVEKRIAELTVLAASRADADGVQAEAIRAEAEQRFEALLENDHVSGDRGAIRYQLAQAADLTGRPAGVLANLTATIEAAGNDAGAAEVVHEARFRRGEIHFSAGRFDEAARDYEVVAAGSGRYSLHAHYMLGWALFKDGSTDLAIPPFVAALDQLLAPGMERDPGGEELLSDLTRVTVMALDDLDGPVTLAEAMAAAGEPPAWQTYLYRALGDWYQARERFQDSARTWETFITNNPLHVDTPQIHLAVIETWRAAGFVAEIEPRQRDFVERFDKRSRYYEVHGEDAFARYAETLAGFMDRFTAAAHAAAQATQEPAAYREAADWYLRWLANFEDSPRAAEMRFLMGEALTGAGDWRAAIAAFRTVWDHHADSEQAREAGYAIVALLAEHAAGHELTDERIDAGLAFAARYPEDARAPAAHIKAAQLLFELGRFEEAVLAAEAPLAATAAGELGTTALRILAHGRFELGSYTLAEQAYRALLALTPNDTALQERLLATVFRQGEMAESGGDLARAIYHFDRLAEVDPASQLAIDARFDVAALYERSGNVAAATGRLESFRREFASHPAVAGIPLRLVALYEQDGRFDAAATELRAIHAGRTAATVDAEARRLALYRAGELALAGGVIELAIDSFRTYAHEYVEPFALRMEAMQHMDALYQRTGEPDKRRFWQRKKVTTFDAAPAAERDDRTRYLAADAAWHLARDAGDRFAMLPLTAPLQRSLKAKQSAMKAAIKAYERAVAFGVVPIAGNATFRIGAIYEDLAAALMASDKPGGLNALETEQYEVLLEEQAFPFEERAIEIHAANLRRGWQAAWDEGVSASLASLRALSPGRYARDEEDMDYVTQLY